MEMNAHTLKELGNQASAAGDYSGALKYYTEALALDPSNHVLYSNRSIMYAKLEKWPESFAEANKAVSINPNWSKGHLRRGIALSYLRRYEEAKQAYQTVLKLDPGNTQAAELLAKTELFMSDTSNRVPSPTDFPDTKPHFRDNSPIYSFQEKNNNPKDDIDFYAILGIPKEATTAQIKKAYYQKARNFHPDKNADNPQAEEMFKLVSEAYNVLSDEEKRKVYDKFGVSGVRASEQGGGTDPGMIFKMLFGCGTFDDIFGELSFASWMSNSGQDMTENQIREQKDKENIKRKEKLLEQLIERLKKRISGEEKNFNYLLADTKEKIESVGGPALLSHISYIYIQEAQKNLDRYLGIQSWFAEIEEKGHSFKQGASLIGEVIRVTAAHSRFEQAGDQNEEVFKEMMNHGLSMLWKLGLLEIENTVREVCKLFLVVPDKELKKKRAEALEALGLFYKQEVKAAKKKGTANTGSLPFFSFGSSDSEPQFKIPK
jgi:curved DNA-binding protein CbpA